MLDIHLKDTPYLRVVLVWVLASVCLIGSAQSLGGFVRDSEGKGLPQANIRIAGTRIGTSCNNHGHYHLESVPSGNISVIASYLGYKSDTLSILIAETGRITLDFVLVFDAMWISEMEVIARSSRAEEMLQLPVRTHILEKADIMQSPASSSPALLSSLPGIVVNSDFGLFSSANVSIRGVGGNSQTGTLVVMDGMPLNKADGGSVNWNIIDKDNIETIEIVKGPGSALYGSNAMGGVINIVSRPPAGKFKLNLSSSYGTYNTFEFKAQATGSLKGSGMYYKAFAQYRNSDGYINTPDEIIKENDSIVVPVFVDELFAGGLLGFNLKKHGSIEASYNYFRDVRGRGTKIYEELGSSISRDTQQGFVKYRGRFARWSTYAIAYGLKEKYFRLNEYFSDGEYKLYEVDSDRNDLGFRMLARRDIKKRGNLVLGAEARNGSVNARDVYYTSTDIISNKGEMDILAAFIQYRQISKRSRLTLVAGLRLDFARLNEASFGIEFPSYSVEYFTDFGFKDVKAKYWNAINPKLNLEYAFKRGSNVYLSLAKGFRAPILDDMCRSERSRMGLRIANPELRPEHIYSAETGFLHKFPKNVQLEMSVFFSKGYDFMYLLSNGDSVNLGYTLAPVYKTSNITAVTIRGFEAGLKMPFSLYGSHKTFINYSFNQSQIDRFTPFTAADPDLGGKFLTNIPNHTWAAGAVVKTTPVDVSATLRFTGKRWVREDNTVDQIYLMTDKYPEYLIFDAMIQRNIKSWNIALQLDNLFNKIFINNRGYKSPGRMLFLKVTYSYTEK